MQAVHGTRVMMENNSTNTIASSRKLIWTADAIGARIGRSGKYVRNKLIDMPGTPVHKVDSRYYAYEDELIGFFHKPVQKSPV